MIYYIIFVIIILFIISLLIIGIYFFNYSQRPNFSKTKLFKNKKPLLLSSEENKKWFKEKKHRDIYIKSRDKKKLHAYQITNNSNEWVIILHGYTNEGIDLLNISRHFYEKKINILLVDQRAHGKSEGIYSSLGWKERFDTIDWINYIVKKNNNCKIILYGISMGATTVMMTCGEKLTNNVKLAIEDCGFVSIYNQFYHQLAHKKLMPKPIIFLANNISRLLRNFNVYKAKGLNQIKKATIPMLFIHGEDDKLVPLSTMLEAYNNYGGKKEQLIIKNAKHMASQIIEPKKYLNKIDKFIDKYF